MPSARIAPYRRSAIARAQAPNVTALPFACRKMWCMNSETLRYDSEFSKPSGASAPVDGQDATPSIAQHWMCEMRGDR
jgi:hypothetical protein